MNSKKKAIIEAYIRKKVREFTRLTEAESYFDKEGRWLKEPMKKGIQVKNKPYQIIGQYDMLAAYFEKDGNVYQYNIDSYTLKDYFGYYEDDETTNADMENFRDWYVLSDNLQDIESLVNDEIKNGNIKVVENPLEIGVAVPQDGIDDGVLLNVTSNEEYKRETIADLKLFGADKQLIQTIQNSGKKVDEAIDDDSGTIETDNEQKAKQLADDGYKVKMIQERRVRQLIHHILDESKRKKT